MSSIDRSAPSSELLRTFCAVAQAGNVTRASEILARSQSAISLQIRKLEEHLDVTLFDRKARGVVLTEAGRKLLPAASKALAQLNEVGQLFAEPLRGRIKVGIPDDYTETILESALAAFSKAHGDVEVLVTSGCTAGFPDAIKKQELDIAVYTAGMDTQIESFFSEPMVWVCSAEFKVDDTKPIPLAVFDRHCKWRTVASDALDDINREWRTVYLSESYTSIKSAIRAGLAVGTIAKSDVDDSMRVLGEKQGFPKLPENSLSLLRPEGVDCAITDEMAQAITQAIA